MKRSTLRNTSLETAALLIGSRFLVEWVTDKNWESATTASTAFTVAVAVLYIALRRKL